MATTCRMPGCSRPASPGGEFCELHECYHPGCHAARGSENRVYCHMHEAIYYAKTGRYAFRCRVAGCPLPREPSEDYCRKHLGVDDDLPDFPPEERPIPFPVATKVLQAIALVVVLGLGAWMLFLWMAGPDVQGGAGRPAEAAPPLPGAPDEGLLGEADDATEGIGEALQEHGYR